MPSRKFLKGKLSRFLDNPAVRVRDWYEPIARAIIQHLADKEIRLIVDGSRVSFGHQLLMVAIAYRKRVRGFGLGLRAIVGIVHPGSKKRCWLMFIA